MYEAPRKGKSIEIESGLLIGVVVRRKRGLNANEYGVSFLGDENVEELDGDRCITL